MGQVQQIDLATSYRMVRQRTEEISVGLSDEDQCIQSMADASPIKWHRAHTTWFFEQFVLLPFSPDYKAFDPDFKFLFNSYYNAIGDRPPREARGLLSRPGTNTIRSYRQHVDAAIMSRLATANDETRALIELGLQHEQQHQELMLSDLLHAFSQNPLHPAVIPDHRHVAFEPGSSSSIVITGGVELIGHFGTGFAFDSETPRHSELLSPHRLATRLVRNSDWLSFIADGGYRNSELWMSDGWSACCANRWRAPAYWHEDDDGWRVFGLHGDWPIDESAPVCHVSWYEADAYARWAGARLPTESELECAWDHPDIREMTGFVWQWSNSAYLPYPGFRQVEGAIGEYNGKFMINQMVLRGGSIATPAGHARPTYRNFFPPSARWQFSGVRLAWDVHSDA